MKTHSPGAGHPFARKVLLLSLFVAALALAFVLVRRSARSDGGQQAAARQEARPAKAQPSDPRPEATTSGPLDSTTAKTNTAGSAPNAAPRRPKSGGLVLTRRAADGTVKTVTVDYYGPGAPGFIPTELDEALHVQFQWPWPTRNVSVTRMDGGIFPVSAKTVMKVPPSEAGAIDFDFVIGPEPGRYQLEFLDELGHSEAIAFWAGPVPAFDPQPDDSVFIDPLYASPPSVPHLRSNPPQAINLNSTRQ